MPNDEPARLAALQNLGLLDTPPEARFDRITRLACCIAGVPIALISLVDRERQWFKSHPGLALTESSRSTSFCTHAIESDDLLLVEDSRLDPRFAASPLVTGEPYLRFYAGNSIHSPDGSRIGTLCVLDTEPRTLSQEQLSCLAILAGMVDAELLKSRLETGTSAAQIGVYERTTNLIDVWWSDAMWEIFGQDPNSFRPTWPAWLELVHEQDRERVRQSAGSAERPRTTPSIQYRVVRPDGSVRHVQSIATMLRADSGESIGSISGVLLDVTARVENEQRELAAHQQQRELSHRAGMAQVASGVVHHVGNVLNSLGIANTTALRNLKSMKPERLQAAVSLISENRPDLAGFLNDDTRGRHLPDYLTAFAAQLAAKIKAVDEELLVTGTLLEQLRNMVEAQATFARPESPVEVLDVADLVDTVLGRDTGEFQHLDIERHYGAVPLITTNRHKLAQILIGLLRNACEAVSLDPLQPAKIAVRLSCEGDDVLVAIEDSGIGLTEQEIAGLWVAGYTTKPHGKGLGLHNSANTAREIGAALGVHSEGRGKGACFTLRIPVSGAIAAQQGYGPSDPPDSTLTTIR